MERERKTNSYKKNWEGTDAHETEVSTEGNIITHKGERERDGDKNMLSFKKVKKKNPADLEDIQTKTLHFSWQERKQNLTEIYMRET